jgi:TatD DNase family protein
MKLFDVHCHLQDEALFPGVGKVIERATAAGVERLACCGTSSGDWDKVFQLAAQFQQIIPMIGIHPWFVKDHKEEFEALEKRVRKNPSAGIGETGLDFFSFAKATAAATHPGLRPPLRRRGAFKIPSGGGVPERRGGFPRLSHPGTSTVKYDNRAEQEECFAAHLDLARELNRPVAVHCVQAWGRLIEILREHPGPRILLHAFGGSAELIPELAELNCWFSFCGSVANPNAKRVRASAAAVPDDRLLIETDSPDFPPPDCPVPNEPANLVHTARAVAELRGISAEKVAALTFSNAERFFVSV